MKPYQYFYSCTCEPGYTGINCTEDIDECASNPCHNSGTCTNMNNEFLCTCAAGFSGKTCEEGEVKFRNI